MGATEGRIGLCQLLVQLPFQPIVQLLHRRPALLLMPLQPRSGDSWRLPGDGIVAVNHGERFEQVAALLRKTIVHVDELPPGMGQAVGQDRLQFARQVARQGIAHLDRRRQLRSTELEHPGQILTRVLAAAKEQGHPVTVARATTPEVNRPVRLVGVGPVAIGTGLGFWPAAAFPSAPGS